MVQTFFEVLNYEAENVDGPDRSALNHICGDLAESLWDGDSMDLSDLMATSSQKKSSSKKKYKEGE